jgi:IS5 family transposase
LKLPRGHELTTAKKQTKREKFLVEMGAVVPWAALVAQGTPSPTQGEQKGYKSNYER